MWLVHLYQYWYSGITFIFVHRSFGYFFEYLRKLKLVDSEYTYNMFITRKIAFLRKWNRFCLQKFIYRKIWWSLNLCIPHKNTCSFLENSVCCNVTKERILRVFVVIQVCITLHLETRCTYFMMPLMTPTDGSSDGCFPALLIGVGPVSCTKPTRTPTT